MATQDGTVAWSVIANRQLITDWKLPVNFVKEKGLIATEVYKISEWLNVAGYKRFNNLMSPDFIYRAAYLGNV